MGNSSTIAIGAHGDPGRYVTIDGHAVFIPDRAGIVPERLKADAGANKRFSKAALQRRLVEHHRDFTGESGDYTQAMEDELTSAGGSASDAFKFHRRLPTEIKDAIADNPALRRVFQTTDNVREAHGNDAFAELGDRYVRIAEARAGSPVNAALETARGSQDPEIRLLAHVHDNLPDDPGAMRARATKLRRQGKTARADRLEAAAADTPGRQAIAAGGLRVGDQFRVNGQKFRVAEDADGYRVLRSHEYGADTPVDAVSHLPIDKGTFKPGRVRGVRWLKKGEDVIPF